MENMKEMAAEAERRINELFDELVPACGTAETVAGEIIRAVSRIAYRNWNDGDHIGIGYGKETCNPAARFLLSCGGNVRDAVLDAWGVRDDDMYDVAVLNIETAVLEYLDQRPELKTTANHIDMLDCADPELDVDDYEDEEEYEEEYEDEEEDWL